jgi:hypothetical protein
MQTETGNIVNPPRSRSRSKAKRKKKAAIQLIKMIVIIALIGLFIWSMFSMILETNVMKDRRNTGQNSSQIFNCNSKSC